MPSMEWTSLKQVILKKRGLHILSLSLNIFFPAQYFLPFDIFLKVSTNPFPLMQTEFFYPEKETICCLSW